MTSKAFVVPCLLSTFKYLNWGCSNYELAGPLMEKLKISVNYISINNQDVSGVPVHRRLPQIWLGSQTKSDQTQTDMITNVTFEHLTNIFHSENAAEFSRTIDIILCGYGCMEIDSNTLFVKFIFKKSQVLNIVFFALLYIKNCYYTSVRRSRVSRVTSNP